MSFSGKKVLVVGLAKSGLAAARLLADHGANVTITDEQPRSKLKSVLKEIPKKVKLVAGKTRFDSSSYDLIVTSPGVPWQHPDLVQARKKGIPVWPELELAWQFVTPYKTVAITGTNGKTTTTALIGEILRRSGRKTVIGGNIGTPLSALVKKITPKTFLVLEVSSYQLEGHSTFHPNVGILLNVTPDHLKRHGTMAGYAAAKARLFECFQRNDTAVLNQRDVWCRRIGRKINSRKIWFPEAKLRRLSSHLQLPGEHNQENAMASVAACQALGLSSSEIKRGLEFFKGVPHRIQRVRSLGGVLYVNDSKSTNVDSTTVALKSFSQPTILILGGQHKGSPYSPLIPLIKKSVKQILTIGEAAGRIEKDLKGSAPIRRCGTLESAVRWSYSSAKSGDVVLLSPACASFDQFQNFEHRGERFMALVNGLRP